MKNIIGVIAISSIFTWSLLSWVLPLSAQEVNPEPNPAPTVVPTPQPPGELEQVLASRPVVNGVLSVEEAVAIALRESPVIRGAVTEVEAAEGRINAARAERRPMLTANTFLSAGTIGSIVESPELPVGNALMNVPRGPFADQNLTLMAPLYTGGRLKAMVRQAQALRNASAAELEAQRQEVALLTRTAYREVQARRALLEVQRARLRENEEQLRIDRVRAEEGKIPPFFVLRQEAEVADTKQEITNVERDIELSLWQLKTVMGVNPASEINVTAELRYEPSVNLIKQLGNVETAVVDAPPVTAVAPPVTAVATGIPTELGALLRAAERQRPELQSARLRIAGAQLETSVIEKSYKPQVNAFVMGDVMKGRGMGLSGGTTFGLAASIPIFTGGRRKAATQTAEAEQRRLEAERERVALEVAQSVNAAYRNLRAAEVNITTAEAGLRAAQEDYRVARIRYESGRSVYVEVLDALAARVRGDSNVVQALYNYNVARDQLLRAVGVLQTSEAAASEATAAG